MFANRYIRGIKIPCVALYIVVVMVIIAYGYFIRHSGSPDYLERKIIDHPSVPGCDGWAMTHFMFWGILGLLYPGHHLQALLASLGWEGIEHTLGQCKVMVGGKRLQLVGAQDEDGYALDSDSEDEDSQYWYGRFVTDTFYNMAGYTIGSTIADKWWPNTA